jgi:dUTPase
MKISAGVIDSGYRDEILVMIYNGNKKPVVLSPTIVSPYETDRTIFYPTSKAIAQGLIVAVPQLNIIEKTVEEIKAITSLRGEGKLGSSEK